MTKTPTSFNSQSSLGSSGKSFLVPTTSQVVLYLLISILLLTVFNFGRLWDYLNNVILASEGGLGGVITENSSTFQRFLDSFSHSIVLQVVFWVCIGSLIYVLIWFMRNIVINLLNDVVADSYVHPRGYNRFRYWGSIISRKVFFGISLAVLLFYLFAGTRLVGSFAALVYMQFGQITTPKHLLEITGAVVVTMALIHSFILISHITVNSWRFIYRDL